MTEQEKLHDQIKVLSVVYGLLATTWAKSRGVEREKANEAMNFIADMRRCRINAVIAMGGILDFDKLSDGDDSTD